MKPILIVLFGDKDQGKTTTLLKLSAILACNDAISPELEESMKTILAGRGKRMKDARLIVEYQGISIFIATGGDNWAYCRANMNFFDCNFKNMADIYRMTPQGLKELTKIEKDKYKSEKRIPDIAISACRPSADDYGAIKAIHSHLERKMDRYESQIWTLKNRETTSTTKAEEIKQTIDKYLQLKK